MVKRFIAKEMFETGLVITLVFLGFTYFQYIDYWQDAAIKIAEEQGVLPANATSTLEQDPIYQTLNSIFIQYIFLFGILITLLGLFLMTRFIKTKGELYREIGKDLSLAPIWGILIFYLVKVVSHYMYFNSIELGFLGGDLGVLIDINTYANPQVLISMALFFTGLFIYFRGKRLEKTRKKNLRKIRHLRKDYKKK